MSHKENTSAAREAVLTETTSSCKHVDWLIEQREFKNRMEPKSLACVRKEKYRSKSKTSVIIEDYLQLQTCR